MAIKKVGEHVDPETGEVHDVVLQTPFHDANGHEILDPRPMALPVGFQRPPTLAEQVARLVRGHMSDMAAADGFETFEDADDFELDEDIIVPSPWEDDFDLATIQAVDRGIVQAPDLKQGREASQRVAEARRKSKAPSPPAEQPLRSDEREGDL